MTRDEIIAEVRNLASSYFPPEALAAIEERIPEPPNEPGVVFMQVTPSDAAVRLEISIIFRNSILDVTHTGAFLRTIRIPLNKIGVLIFEEGADKSTLSVAMAADFRLRYSASSKRARDQLQTFALTLSSRIEAGA
jgi:hypothetical protein